MTDDGGPDTRDNACRPSSVIRPALTSSSWHPFYCFRSQRNGRAGRSADLVRAATSTSPYHLISHCSEENKQ
jgi:hypothetical protein